MKAIRTSFVGNGFSEDVEDTNTSPTSVVDCMIPSAKTFTNKNKKSQEIMIQQLKRRMTVLEHEKANMEKDLMNQMNTVVFDKESIVASLQDKFEESERKYKQERQAHTETRMALRQQRFSNAGEAKFEVFRLQDRVQDLTDEKNGLESEVERLKTERDRSSQSTQRLHDRIREITETKNDLQYELDKLITENEEASQSYLSQLTCMEDTHQAQLEAMRKEHGSRVGQLEQSRAAVLADLERDLFERQQSKLSEVEQFYKAEMQTVEEEKQTLLQQISELKQKGNSNSNGIDNRNISRADQNDEDTALQSEIMSLVNKLSRAEAENMNLQDALMKEKEAKTALENSLQDSQQKMSDHITLFEEERIHLTAQLEEEEKTNHSLKQSLEALQESFTELSSSKMDSGDSLGCSRGEKAALLEQISGLQAQIADSQKSDEELHIFVSELEARDSDLRPDYENRLEEEKALVFALQSEKDSLLHQLNDLQNQVEEGDAAVGTLKAAITDLENMNSELFASEKGSLLRRNAAIGSFRDQVHYLTTQIKQSKYTNEKLKGSLADLESTNKALPASPEQKDTAISHLEEERDELLARNNDLLQLLDVARLRESTLGNSLKQHQDTILDLKATLNERNEMIENVEAEIQDLRDQLVQEQTTIASLMDSLGEEAKTNSELNANQNDKEEATRKLEHDRNRLLDEMEDIRAELQDERDTVKSLKAYLKSEKSENIMLVTKRNDLEEKVADLNEQIEQLNGTISALQNTLKWGAIEKEEISKARASHNDKFLRLKEDNESLVDRIDALTQQLEHEKKTVKQQIETIWNYKSCLESECDAKMGLMRTTETLKSEITVLQQSRDSLVDHIETLKLQLEDEKEAVATSRRFVEEKESVLHELKMAKDEKIWAWQKHCVIFHVQATTLRNQLEHAETAKKELQDLTEKQQSQIFADEKAIQQSHRDRISLLDRIGDLKQTLQAQNANESLQSSLDEYKESCSQLQSTCVSNEEKIAQQGKTITLLQDKARQLRSHVYQQQSHIAILKASLQGAHRQIENFEEEKKELCEYINSNMHGLENLKMEMAKEKGETPMTSRQERPKNESRVDSMFTGDSGRMGKDDEAYVRRLQEENLEMKNMIGEHYGIKQSIEVLTTKKRDLLSEIDDLYCQLQEKQKNQPESTVSLEEEQMYSIVKATMDDQRNKAESIKELETKIEYLQEQIRITENRMGDQEMTVEFSQVETERLKSELEAMEAAKRTFISENLSLQNQVNGLELTVTEASVTIERLEGKLSALEQNSSGSLKEDEQKTQDYDAKIGQLESELFAAKQLLNTEEDAVVQGLKSEMECLKSTLAQTDAKRMDREAKLKIAYKREVSQYRERIEAFEQQLLEEKEALQAELDTEKKKCSGRQTEVVRLVYELGATKRALELVQAEKKVFKNRLEDLEAARMESLLLEIREKKQTERIEKELSNEKQNVKNCKEEILKLRARAETLEKNFKSALARAEAAEASSTSNGGNEKTATSQSETSFEEKIHSLECKLALVRSEMNEKTKELEERRKEVMYMRSYLCGNGGDKSPTEFQAELKQLNEKTVMQARMIHSLQKKIEELENSKEKFYEAKRKEIMQNRSEINDLGKENMRLREKVNDLIKERGTLEEQRGSFVNSIGSSEGRFTSSAKKSKNNRHGIL